MGEHLSRRRGARYCANCLVTDRHGVAVGYGGVGAIAVTASRTVGAERLHAPPPYRGLPAGGADSRGVPTTPSIARCRQTPDRPALSTPDATQQEAGLDGAPEARRSQEMGCAARTRRVLRRCAPHVRLIPHRGTAAAGRAAHAEAGAVALERRDQSRRARRRTRTRIPAGRTLREGLEQEAAGAALSELHGHAIRIGGRIPCRLVYHHGAAHRAAAPRSPPPGPRSAACRRVVGPAYKQQPKRRPRLDQRVDHQS